MSIFRKRDIIKKEPEYAIKTVIKRDGSKEDFNVEKIKSAIYKAFNASELYNHGDFINFFEKFDKNVLLCIPDSELSVEDIQDIIERSLMSLDYFDVAKRYIIYRERHKVSREENKKLIAKIADKLEGKDIKNQNANVDERSFGGRLGEATRVVTKDYALKYCMSETSRNNHLNNEIYIHDLDSYAVGMHNCTIRSTKFITDSGVFSFRDFNDRDKINVLTHTGEFRPAIVRYYGKKKMNAITFVRAGQKQCVEYFTPDHRWILKDGSTTTKLKVGDQIYKAPVNIRKFDFDLASKSEKYYWCLGFVLADGTEAYRWSHGVKKNNIKFVRLRLCGEKIKYKSRFDILKHSTKKLDNGDLYLTFSSVIGFRKLFPDLSRMSYNEKLALFDGLYCADGQNSRLLKSILTTNEQIASFIEDSPSLGYFILSTKDLTGEKTNYKIRGFTKKFRFIGDSNKYFWTVSDIKPSSEEEAWCLEVEKDHSFVLPNGIVTGNCLTIPFDNLLAKGFNTRQTDVRPANSINTAMQLIAVLFQIQSLQQFGGVSASHIDWTLVPYVRKSFYKYYSYWVKNVTKSKDFEDFDPTKVSITDRSAYKYQRAWDYAMDMTKKETYQAAEGLINNLNTLQSRSGNQLKSWLAI